jgi:hypothetical protein
MAAALEVGVLRLLPYLGSVRDVPRFGVGNSSLRSGRFATRIRYLVYDERSG